MSAITGLDVIYGQSTSPKPGYTQIPFDLNKGAGYVAAVATLGLGTNAAKNVYLCYSTTEGGSPITNIQVFAGGSEDFEIQDGYEKIPKDLNKGGGGKYIYLCYTRNDAFPPIAAVNVIQSPIREVYPTSPDHGWVRINQDCTQGTGGEYTYVVYKYMSSAITGLHDSAMSAITGLDVIYDESTPPKPGYHKIDIDLNKGAGGKYIYVCYSTTESGPPITNIQVFAGGSEDFEIQDGYEKIPNDLNKGAGGKYIYLCCTRNAAFPPITAVNVIQSSSREVYPPSAEWVRIEQDCSESAGGQYTFVVYKY